MSRWEPNGHERLMSAALELFGQRGYDNVTVAEIAQQAGLTKRTFFRHFADKREVLFFGEDALRALFAEAIVGAPESATPIDAIEAALRAAGTVFGSQRREPAMRREAVIASHTDLRERELLKRASLAEAVADALRQRGIAEPTAGLAAELFSLALRTAFDRWIEPANRETFTELAKRALADLRSAAGALDSRAGTG